MNAFISQLIAALYIPILAGVLALGWLGVSSASADEYGSFDETGQYRYHSYSPSNRSRDAELDRKMHNDYQNRQIQKQNDETIRSHDKSADHYSTPSYSSPNTPYLVFPGPGQRPLLCQRSFQAVYCN